VTNGDSNSRASADAADSASTPFEPGGSMPADSAGVPWKGRDLKPSPFSGDDGHADPELAAVQEQWRSGAAGLPALVRALAGKRVVIPVMAQVENLVMNETTNLVADKDASTGVVCVSAPDGRIALPVFTSVPALMRWRGDARPIPVESERAALAAVSEEWPLLVLDAGDGQPAIIPRPAVWALAQGKAHQWIPAPEDAELAAEINRLLSQISVVNRAEVGPGKRAETAVTVQLQPGLDRQQLQLVLQEVQERLGRSEMVAERVDGLELRAV